MKEFNYKESKYAAMTSDMKCIVRGTAKSGYILTTLNEKCRSKLRLFRTATNIGYVDFCRDLKVTPAVEELYDLTNNKYDCSKIPKIVAVKVKCTTSISLGNIEKE